MKETAVEWLVDELLDGRVLMPLLIEQAKEMEKQQIFDSQVDVLSEHIAKEHFRKQRDEGLLEQLKMYSEEDMIKAFNVGFNVGYNDETSPSYLTAEKFIEQFKKK